MGGVSVSHRTASHPLNHIHPTLCTPACLSLLICLSVRREREREEESENASERSYASTPHTNHTQSHSLTAPITHHSQHNDSLTAERAEVPHFCAKSGAVREVVHQ